MQKATTQDILQLIKGKPSKNKVGARTVPHRLNKIEHEKFNIAIKLNYLKYNNKTRLALLNSFDEYQLAKIGYSLKLNSDIYQIEIITHNQDLLENISSELTGFKIINNSYGTLTSSKNTYKNDLQKLLTFLNN